MLVNHGLRCQQRGKGILPQTNLRSATYVCACLRCRVHTVCDTRQHPPLEPIFKARLLRTEYDSNTKRHVFGKLSVGSVQGYPVRDRHSFRCGVIELSKSVQGGVLSCVTYGMYVRLCYSLSAAWVFVWWRIQTVLLLLFSWLDAPKSTFAL